jgi:alkaline phosphatase D
MAQHEMDRRRFVAALVAGVGGAGLAAACGTSTDRSASPGTGAAVGTSSTSALPTITAKPAPALRGPAFTLGVASGDPLADRVILWTRLAPDPLSLDRAGMPDLDVEVEWEIATDDTFTQLVNRGVAVASAALGHSVHVDATGLEPDRWYAYRFRLGDEVSPVGRTRTFPATGASPDQLRLAVTSCQDYGSGRYAAYRDLVAQDLDVVLFLGDYIYETPGLEDAAEAVAQRRYVGGFPVTVDDYRRRYAQHHLDPELAEAHQALPWIITFDDHEVINNYAGDDGALAGVGETFLARRAAAYQAWYENLPLRIDPPVGSDIVVHRASSFGDLARLFVIETRQHADPAPCRDTSTLDSGTGCEEQQDEARTALGAEQEAWLVDAMAENEAQWQLLVNPVLLAGLDISPPDAPPAFYLETWDGYPAERRRIVSAIKERKVRNPVVLTGDYHASFVADVRPDPFDPESPVVAPELLATSISSVVFPADHTAANPHVRYFEARNGYLVCEVTSDAITAEFRYVADVSDPASPVSVGATFVVTAADEDGVAPTVERA